MEEFEKLDLIRKNNVDIEDLLLDPNNPRFSRHTEDLIPEDKIADPKIQKDTFERMVRNREFAINELETSIKTRGFAPVDNIFIKSIKGTKKYLVVEGNRRVTAVKLLLMKHELGKKKDILPENILNSMKRIDCLDHN